MESSIQPSPPLTFDHFYGVRKSFMDAQGNIQNKEKYPFLNVLTAYLQDIVTSIDVEIKNSSRHSSVINWREKKNPKLLSKLINIDDNINIINRSINKITGSNYLDIVNEINKIFINNTTKSNEYTKYIFESVIKKCIVEEMFCKDYMLFLTSFKDAVGRGINEAINNFSEELYKILESNDNITDFSFHSNIKDIAHYRNIGMIFGNIYLLNSNGSSTHLNINNNELVDKIIKNVENINNFLDWLPVNMDELHGRIYLMIGILETIAKHLYYYISADDKEKINEVLNSIYNFKGMINKIKFKVLDLQDIIKGIMTMKHNVPIAVENQRIAESIKKNMPYVSVVSNTTTNNTPLTNTSLNNTVNSPSEELVEKNIENNNTNIISTPVQSNSTTDLNKKKSRKEVPSNNSKARVINKEEKKNIYEILRNQETSLSDNDDDGFIKIERKGKKSPTNTPVNYNVYKPKKTAELAKEGSSIYGNNSKKNKKNN